uniref:Palmitoyltransferase n=1 Tax=Lepisosteus oculatus TaxID=7918 RepID=W5MBK7_LEPOC
MDWEEEMPCQSHGHFDQAQGHSHGHGHGHGHSGHMHGFMPDFHGQFGHMSEATMDPTQQPKRRSFMEDSNNYDIVKATQYGVIERCKELIEAGYDVRQPDKENVSLLHWAAINNRTELVKYYISKGAIIDQLGGDLNSTPLHWAIRQGHLPMVVLLLRYGADPALVDGEGFSSVHLAVLFQHMPIIAYLFAKGQDVDLPDLNGQTPLMLAAQKIIGPEPTRFLLKFNASVNAVDRLYRNTPLHCAVLAGNVDAAHILLEAGASVDIQNAKGETPIDLAHQVHSPLLIHMLTQVKYERSKSNSLCFRFLQTYKFHVMLLLCTLVLWALGAIADMQTESWLLKGILFACLCAVINLTARPFLGQESQGKMAVAILLASFFWMAVTWYMWFLPDILAKAIFQLPFTVCITGLFYYYIRSWKTDPGFIKVTEEDKKKNVVLLAEAGCLDVRIFCTSCLMRKPLRSVHCFLCDSCVARQDHHSIWINGCIGARNHRYFVMFVFFLTVVGTWMFYGTLVYWSSHCKTSYQVHGLWGVLTQVAGCSPWVLYIFLIAFFHTAWSSLLLLTQLYQIAFFGLTSAERMNLLSRKQKAKQSFSLRQNPYNQGCVKNMVNFFQLKCCGLFKPTVVDWTQEYSTGLEHPVAGPFHTV